MTYSRTCTGYTRNEANSTTFVNWSDGTQSELVGTPDEIREQVVALAEPTAKIILEALAIQSLTADDPAHNRAGPQFPAGRTFTLDMTGVVLSHSGD